ncbi:hypothetical protein [Salinibacter ruber]|uniref:Uncharacterized protein n=1 Tax=Salinibacter ruber TaxID=146919 RepID=A0A9X2TIT4_9BACT|nr:hypothetical protein [Salinibacter ruber]MCS3661773.1 hypothetical protein [Salinibacter ruber]MCS3711566.1 hypothetical protein [Salinibacter ruber]
MNHRGANHTFEITTATKAFRASDPDTLARLTEILDSYGRSYEARPAFS